MRSNQTQVVAAVSDIPGAVSPVDPAGELDRLLPGLMPALAGYCYRMLGSAFDADDAVQETIARAWTRVSSVEHAEAVQSWVFRIATNVCFDMLRSRQRRALPMDLARPGMPDQALGPALSEPTWVTPVPIASLASLDEDPADVAVRHENVRLAFVAALQHLPPRQRAVLILREVLRWRAKEVAELLETSTVAVNGALRRARETLASVRRAPSDAATALTAEQRQLVDRYVRALEISDLDALVSLVHEDVVVSMPPYALWLQGKHHMLAFLKGHTSDCDGNVHIPVEVNASAGLAFYRPTRSGDTFEPFSIQVIDLVGPSITAIHNFLDVRLFERFGLPAAPVAARTLTALAGGHFRGAPTS
jgi:RNA polymerase sigma-70 factor (ECF subfamily)